MIDFSHEWLCRRLVEDSRDAVIFADREGIIRLWNAGAAEMFGYGPAELGQPLDLIIPENLRARHNEGYLRVMAAGVSKYAKDLLAVPGLTKDGADFPGIHHHPGAGRKGPNPGRRRHHPGRHGPLAAGPGAEKTPGGPGGASEPVGRVPCPPDLCSSRAGKFFTGAPCAPTAGRESTPPSSSWPWPDILDVGLDFVKQQYHKL